MIKNSRQLLISILSLSFLGNPSISQDLSPIVNLTGSCTNCFSSDFKYDSVDFSGIEFNGLTLEAVNIENSDFSEAKFSMDGRLKLDYVMIYKSDFSHTFFHQPRNMDLSLEAKIGAVPAIFSGAANIARSAIVESNFSSAIFIGATFLETSIVSSNFSSSQLGARFQGCILSDVDFSKALDGPVVVDSTIDNANFSGAQFRLYQDDFPKALDLFDKLGHLFQSEKRSGSIVLSNIYNSNFSNATFRHFLFDRVYIQKSDFKDSDLRYTTFANSDMYEIDFSNSDLRYADFSGSTLTEVDFTGADLKNANFSGAILCGAISPTGEILEIGCQ